MPRPNPPRSIASEQSLARRVAHERETRGMSYEGLAARMTKAGCPIQASALYKIEKSTPPRRITVDELVALAQVFDLSVENLLLPPEAVAAKELGVLVIRWNDAHQHALQAKEDDEDAWQRVKDFIEEHPEVKKSLEPMMRKWSQYYFEDDHDFRVAFQMHRLTGAAEWSARAKAELDAMIGVEGGER